MIEVCTVWAPRPEHAQWRDDYERLLALQRATAHRFGHRHVIVTDDSRMMDDTDAIVCTLPADVMPAMIAGVVRRLYLPLSGPVVFVDVDVLIGRDLSEAFDGSFDLGLTRRINDSAPVNNGAMYVAAPLHPKVREFFDGALARCGTHWGADQESISEQAAPVPDLSDTVAVRDGMRLAFLSMKSHNAIPKMEGRRHVSNPYCIHFKGETKKWAQTYADRFILGSDDGSR